MKTLVLGASLKPQRYANKAIRKLRSYHHEVVAIGLREGRVEDVDIVSDPFPFHDVHTVTLYLGPQNQEEYFDYVVSLKPKRVIFNPGTENETFAALLKTNGIEVDYACTLVLLSTGLY